MSPAMSTNSLPLLQHSLESPSAFTPERLMEAVRAERSLANEPLPRCACSISMAICPTGSQKKDARHP
jgi:hypothetical protein